MWPASSATRCLNKSGIRKSEVALSMRRSANGCRKISIRRQRGSSSKPNRHSTAAIPLSITLSTRTIPYLANRNYPSPWNRLNETAEWEYREHTFYREVTRIFTTSNYARESLIRATAWSRGVCNVFIQGEHGEFERTSSQDGIWKANFFVGYDWERKGGPVLMEAFDRVVRAIPDAELWVVGCAPDVKNSRCRVFGKLS